MSKSPNKWIASRELKIVSKETGERKTLRVLIGIPWKGENDEFATCVVRFDGLFECDTTATGVDTLQALQLAANIDLMLAGFKDRFDFYWESGDAYDELDERSP
jgi:hypothetical protein